MAASVFDSARHGDHQFEMRRKASFSKVSGEVVPRCMAGMYSDESCQLQPQKSQLFQLMPACTPVDKKTIQQKIVNHVEYTLSRTRFNFYEEDCYRATAYSIRDRLIETLKDTSTFFHEKDVKRCYYLSLEFLVGRAMQNALVNLDIEDRYREALADLGYNLESLYEYEHDAALGNGGLGRLAACFLDSFATCNFACWGYGIRYTYGIFEQKIVNGRQVEYPDYWLLQDNPWEIKRPDITYAVRFYGEVKQATGPDGKARYRWTGGELVQAIAYDNPVPGFDSYNCINLRLWKAAPSREFDFSCFNQGRYIDAIAERQNAECISAVLYPNDESEEGKVLRLKQQYFFCCATIQDTLRRFKHRPNIDWAQLPEKMSIQLNDTHPTIAIPELMRILVDVEDLEWDTAWDLTRQVFNYTNHTVLPEALERWPVDLVGRLLPRHLLIINDINMHFLTDARACLGDDKIARMSVYEEGWTKMLRMANLAVIGSNKVNGVAAIHSKIVKRDLFPEFVEYYEKRGVPDKFINITNGVSPRRWMHCANRPLANLISAWLGSDEWLTDMQELRRLGESDSRLVKEWQEVKLRNKQRLAKHIERHVGVKIDPVGFLFDVQVKRFHEYKRQALNCFHMIHRYLAIKKMSPEQRAAEVVPRVCVVSGKAAPGYFTAKTIIKMINSLADIVNTDEEVASYLKVVYVPNYNVSQAMIIVPAADVNQQISTAGTEASGTSNMKFVMNGSLILGTLDGATVEIREACGKDTVLLFGAKEDEVGRIRERARAGQYPIDAELMSVFDWILSGKLAAGDKEAHEEFCQYIRKLLHNQEGHVGDYYLCCYDFPDYVRANLEADLLYKDQTKWTQLAIKAASAMGTFSTDRTIREYASLIWKLEATERPAPSASQQAGHENAASQKSPSQKPASQNITKVPATTTAGKEAPSKKEEPKLAAATTTAGKEAPNKKEEPKLAAATTTAGKEAPNKKEEPKIASPDEPDGKAAFLTPSSTKSGLSGAEETTTGPPSIEKPPGKNPAVKKVAS